MPDDSRQQAASSSTVTAPVARGIPVTGPGSKVAVVFQHFGLFPGKTVHRNVALPLHLPEYEGLREQVWAELWQPRRDRAGPAAERETPRERPGD